MSTISPVAQQAFKELKAANQELLLAMAQRKRQAEKLAHAEQRLTAAKRNVELLLQAVQPELLCSGELPS